MAQLFGKNYQEAGSSSSPLLLRSNGEIKLQWGNKFIDLVKNGKINSEAKDCIFTVDTSDEIKANGIYLVTEDSSIWINVEGTKAKLSDNDTTYVSFLTEQETTPEQKQQALTNLGLIYENIDALNKANLVTGLAYVVESNKLYLIQNKVVSEYQVASALPTSGKFDDLTISNLTIKNDTINSNQLSFTIGNIQYLQLKNSQIICSMPLLSDTIQSSNYIYNSSGFSLSYKQGKSSLDIDSINWRNIESELPKNQKEYIEYTIIGEYNIVTSTQQVSSNNSTYNYRFNLKYPNTLSVNDFIEAEINTTYNVYLIKEEIKEVKNGTDVINQNWFYLNKNLPAGFILKVVLDDDSIVYYGSEAVGGVLKLENSNNIESKHVVSAQLVVKKEEAGVVAYIPSTKYFVDVTTRQKHSNKPLECEIIEVNDKYIIVSPLDQEAGGDIIASSQFKIYKARVPQFIQGEGFLVLREWDSENNKYIYHTKIGTISTKEFKDVLQAEWQEDLDDKPNIEYSKVGIYSDNFIGINSQLYNAVFKKGQLYPRYDKDLTIPEGTKKDYKLNKKFDTVIPNLKWIKQLMDIVTPIGTIVAWHGDSIPKGWSICDGSNGTPNLIGKFIKADTSEKQDNETDLDNDNKLLLRKEHLPEHHHPHKPHNHILSGSHTYTDTIYHNTYIGSSTTVGSASEDNSTSAIGSMSYGGRASETVSITVNGSDFKVSNKTSEEQSVNWENKKIKIEPHAYSLVFIMKYQNLYDMYNI